MKLFIISFITTFIITACSNNNANSQSSVNSVIISDDTCKKIDEYLSQLEKEKNFSGGLLIIRNGEKIFSKGYGWADKENKIPFTSSTLASVGSITKAFTAAAIMKLAEQGKISLTDPLKKFFPDVPADKASINIHQLLTHSSGFHEFLQNDGGDYEKIETANFLKRAFAEPLAFKPEEKAVYTNVGFSILGIIIEKLSGIDYESYLKKNLFEPIGIRSIGYHTSSLKNNNIAHGYQNGKDWGTIPQHIAAKGSEPYWNLKANGGLEASLDDIYLWTNAISNHKILSDSTIQKMFSKQIVENGYDGRSFFGYGCNIQTSRRNTKVIENGGSNGIYFARLIRYPQDGVIMYMVTNESSVNTNMVLPNVSQLYFYGKIEEDAMNRQSQFENPQSKKIYEIVTNPNTKDLQTELTKANITLNDDMILLEVGEKLIAENKTEPAMLLYKYYTTAFPNIVVAWNDMGDLYRKLDKKAEARKCYQQALKLRPGNPRATENLKSLQ